MIIKKILWSLCLFAIGVAVGKGAAVSTAVEYAEGSDYEW